jgi:2'-hydroxyisoflavone reductase
MKVLLIGGPRFIGLHLIEHALAAGHELTMFNRGSTNPELYPEVERVRGDRTRAEDLDQLRGRTWDVVFDTCGYDVRTVQQTLDVLRGSVGHYTYVSSVGYYANYLQPWDEDGPPAQLEGDPDVPRERWYGGSAHYGPMKVLCEQAVANAFPEHVTIRLTLGVGPTHGRGSSARAMNYWVRRVRDHDSVLVPGPPDRLVDFIDVRDMTEFIVRAAERGIVGPFNMAEPPLPVHDMLTLFKGMYGSHAELVFVEPDWLLAEGVRPNTELPWWIPTEEHRYHYGVDGNKALAHGLRLRPFRESIADSVAWEDANPAGGGKRTAAQAGETADMWDVTMTRERELELLDRWTSR